MAEVLYVWFQIRELVALLYQKPRSEPKCSQLQHQFCLVYSIWIISSETTPQSPSAAIPSL
ncbi:hypothetical protein Sjap_009050 [Stephania japonica]|uniref:Uncharacterized protein n=1 Tax=Stephania japonica TaxID=461633 RepID=A0AAP0JQP4_9MAGN